MAVLNGVNYQNALAATPPVRIHQGEWGGKERVTMDTYTLLGDAADGDTILMGRLPSGAKVTGARVFGADNGGTGTLKLGHTANVSGPAGTDAALDNAYILAADSSGQAYDVSDGASGQRGADIGLVRYTNEVDVQLKFSGVTSGATGNVITVIVKYVLE
jgi:hypothetical protein